MTVAKRSPRPTCRSRPDRHRRRSTRRSPTAARSAPSATASPSRPSGRRRGRAGEAARSTRSATSSRTCGRWRRTSRRGSAQLRRPSAGRRGARRRPDRRARNGRRQGEAPVRSAGKVGRILRAAAIARGVIIRNVQDSVAICPPLIVTDDEIDEIDGCPRRRAPTRRLRLPSSADCWARHGRRRWLSASSGRQREPRAHLLPLLYLACACLARTFAGLLCRLARFWGVMRDLSRRHQGAAAWRRRPGGATCRPVNEPRLAGASCGRRGLCRAFHPSRGWRRIQHRGRERISGSLKTFAAGTGSAGVVQHQRHLPAATTGHPARRGAAHVPQGPYRSKRDSVRSRRWAGQRPSCKRNSEPRPARGRNHLGRSD